MGTTVVLKLELFIVCRLLRSRALDALTLDHRNDCLINTVSIGCAYQAKTFRSPRRGLLDVVQRDVHVVP